MKGGRVMNAEQWQKLIPYIEKALNIKLYEHQKEYLLTGEYKVSGRATGKTMIECIKRIIDLEQTQYKYSKMFNVSNNYGYWYRNFFMDIYSKLRDAKLPTIIITK